MGNKILVIGSVNQDLVIQMDRIPKPGETLFGKNLTYFPGGKGANQAVAAKLLDGDIYFLGKIGADLFGESLKKHLSTLKLDSFIQTVPSSSTGTAVIIVDKDGENSISVIPGANEKFSLSDLGIFENFQENDILLVQNEINLSILKEVIKKAKEKKLVVFYNPAPAIKITDEIKLLCDYIIVNEHELEICFELSNINFENDTLLAELLLNISRKYDIIIILTLGSRGCIAVQNEEIFRLAGHKVEVVDTTGAGDCFCGALVSYISKGKNLRDSLLFANKAASLSVTKNGASSSFPSIFDLTGIQSK